MARTFDRLPSRLTSNTIITIVPVFELFTLEIMAEHNIKTAVLKAGDVIMVEKQKILAATRYKIQLIGF